MQFRNYTVYDKRAFLTLNRLEGKTVQKWSILTQRILIALIGLSILPYGVMRIRNGENGGVPLIVGLLCFILAVFRDHISAWGSKRGMMKGEDANDFFFDGRLFSERNKAGNISHRYAAITEFYRYQGYFFLFLDEKQSLILKENGFLEGTPDQFRAFIEEKTGKKMIDVR